MSASRVDDATCVFRQDDKYMPNLLTRNNAFLLEGKTCKKVGAFTARPNVLSMILDTLQKIMHTQSFELQRRASNLSRHS